MSYVPDANMFGMLSDLGKNLWGGIREYQQKQLLSELGQSLMGGDYNAAAQKALQAGDMGTGLKLLELGQQKQNAAALPALLAQPQFGGQSQQPSIPSGAAGDYFGKLAQVESGGKADAVSPTGARGVYQFMPKTWEQYGQGNINDPAAQNAAVQRLTADNRTALAQALGREPTAGELYLAHQQGAGGAIKLLTNPGATPAELGLGRNVAVNGGNPNAPAAQFVQKWTSKFDNVSSPFGMAGRESASLPQAVAMAQPRPAAPAASEDDGEEDKPAAGAQVAQGAVPAVPGAAPKSTAKSEDNSAEISALRDQQAKLTGALATITGEGPKAAITARLAQIKDRLTELKPDKEKFQIIQTEDGYRAINKSDPSQFQDIKAGKPKSQVDFESRKLIADDLGLTGQERKMFLVNGSLSDKATKDIADANRQREAEADRLGLTGEDRQSYVLNGKVPSAGEKQTGDQANAAIYARRMAEAERVLARDDVEKALMSRQNIVLGSVPSFGNSMVPKEYQLADQAKRDFINAVLRRESGAAIAQSEFDNANKQYFPQPGDSREVLSQKARNRRTAIEGIANAATPSFREEYFGTKKPGLGLGLRDTAPPQQPAATPANGGTTKSGIKWSIE